MTTKHLNCNPKPLRSDEDICVFYTPVEGQPEKLVECNILRDEFCNGKQHSCRFFKTFADYVSEQDAAILANREANRCVGCKYVRTPCLLSSEDAYNDENG